MVWGFRTTPSLLGAPGVGTAVAGFVVCRSVAVGGCCGSGDVDGGEGSVQSGRRTYVRTYNNGCEPHIMAVWFAVEAELPPSSLRNRLLIRN